MMNKCSVVVRWRSHAQIIGRRPTPNNNFARYYYNGIVA